MEGRVTWPTAPVVTETEQRELPLSDTTARFAAWIVSPEGEQVRRWVFVNALAAWERGDSRIGVKRLVEDCRAALTVSIDNRYTSHLARLLVDTYPVLRDLIELRKARAA
jgi:hypothetical protein